MFASIGTEWGVGDGSTTFNVPDFETGNQFLRSANVDGDVATAGGEATHVLTVAETPAHTHTHSYRASSGFGFSNGSYGAKNIGTGTTSSTGGDQAHNNEPQYKGVFRLIKT